MMGRIKNRWLLAGLLALFLVAGLVSAISTLGPAPGDSVAQPVAKAIDTLDRLLLVYADGLEHVAGRFAGNGMAAEAEGLLLRVLLIRRRLLGPTDPRTLAASRARAEARAAIVRP